MSRTSSFFFFSQPANNIRTRNRLITSSECRRSTHSQTDFFFSSSLHGTVPWKQRLHVQPTGSCVCVSQTDIKFKLIFAKKLIASEFVGWLHPRCNHKTIVMMPDVSELGVSFWNQEKDELCVKKMNSTKSTETKKQNAMELYLRREGSDSSAMCIPIASKKIKIGTLARFHSFLRFVLIFCHFNVFFRIVATINGCSSGQENFETSLRDPVQKR